MFIMMRCTQDLNKLFSHFEICYDLHKINKMAVQN